MRTLRGILPKIQTPEDVPLSQARISGGMNTRLDPADLDPSAGVLAENAVVTADYTQRAMGTTALAGTKPDSKPVLMYTQWDRFDGTTVRLRFSEDKVSKYSAGAYTDLTGTINGSATDGIRFTVASDATNDYFIFTNNGADEIQVLNSTATTFADLGNSAKYKYVCAFFNRIVAANLAGASPNPTLVAWSGDLNFTQWNSATDISAGSTPLVEAQADYADPITGLFAFASVMLILRERSLWLATKRPVASNPFAFQAAFPSVGCDTPGSATQTRNGICWYDLRSNEVYYYQVGQSPVAIGTPIKDTIIGAITDKDKVWGSYDYVKNTYKLTIPSDTTTLTQIYEFNFDAQAWTIRTENNAYGFYPIDGGASRIIYDQIVGTYAQLSAASATYDDIGLLAATPPKNYIGYTDGSLRYEEEQDSGSGTFHWKSKVFRIPKDDQMITKLMILFEPTRAGAMDIYYRRNGGNRVLAKTVSFNAVQGRTRAYIKKLVRANDYQFEIESSSGNFKLLEYRIDLTPSKEDK